VLFKNMSTLDKRWIAADAIWHVCIVSEEESLDTWATMMWKIKKKEKAK
jgi:hypothetical protein